MPQVNINGNRIRFDAHNAIGKGGEADIYDIGNNQALKIFKGPDHPDLAQNSIEISGAKARLAIHQTKLQDFPKGLISDRIIRPENIAKDNNNLVVGYTMKYLKGMELLIMLSQRAFRDATYTNKQVDDLFEDIHSTIKLIHSHNVVIGDFNDLNILFNPTDTKGYFLDADSWQYARYTSNVYTKRFVDPLACNPNLELISPHNELTDWYAFSIMLFNSLLYTSPFGGIYRPRAGDEKVKHDLRPVKGISVFHSNVQYPKPATPFNVLTDDILQYFFNTYEKFERKEFPVQLLKMDWKKCNACGTEHARNICPNCTSAKPAVNVQKAMEIRGNVTAHTIFQTRGRIVYAEYQDKLRYIYHEDGFYRREGDVKVHNAPREINAKFRIQKENTMIGINNSFISFPLITKHNVDNFNNIPIFDTNSRGKYWIINGKLSTNGTTKLSNVTNEIVLGDVLTNQTLFWVGENLGFGFYRAGKVNVAFVFNPDNTGINDSVKLPTFNGQLVDSTCLFTKDLVWFFLSINENGRLYNQCHVINKSGQIIASAQGDSDSNNWLSQIRGKCVASNFALVPTDEGIVRIEIQGNSLVETKKFPDTEPFVDSASNLFAGTDGLFVVSRDKIIRLEIK